MGSLLDLELRKDIRYQMNDDKPGEFLYSADSYEHNCHLSLKPSTSPYCTRLCCAHRAVALNSCR